MNATDLEKILKGLSAGAVTVDEAMEKLRDFLILTLDSHGLTITGS